MRMINWIHCNTSNDGPVLSESSVFVELSTSLKDGLFSSSSTSNESDGCSAIWVEGLSGAWGETNSSCGSVIGVSDDSGIASSGSSQWALISWLFLEVAHDGTFWNLTNGEHVSSGEGGCERFNFNFVTFSSTIDVLSGVGSFWCDEKLGLLLVLIWVSEFNFHEWGSSAWVMKDGLHDSLDVAVPFGVIKMPVLRASDSLILVSLEDAIGLSLSLRSDSLTHIF